MRRPDLLLAAGLLCSACGPSGLEPVTDPRYPRPDAAFAQWPCMSASEIESIHVDDPMLVARVAAQLTRADLRSTGVDQSLSEVVQDVPWLQEHAFWFSGRVDDGTNDWWNLGLFDRDVSVEMTFHLANERPADTPLKERDVDWTQITTNYACEGRMGTLFAQGVAGSVQPPRAPACRGPGYSSWTSTTSRQHQSHQRADVYVEIMVDTFGPANQASARNAWLRLGTLMYWRWELPSSAASPS